MRLPLETRLALGMASHEARERRVLREERAVLEREWHEAEELGRATDSLG